MKLYQQLILFVLAATTIPMVVGLAVLRHNEEQLEQRLLTARQQNAQRLVEMVALDVREVIERLQGALGYVKIQEMTPEELQGLLGILYKQSEDIVQVALLDQGGKAVVPGVFLARPAEYPEYAGRLGVSPDHHAAFLSALPLKRGGSAPLGSVVLAEPHRLGSNTKVGFSCILPIQSHSAGGRWLAVAEVSLTRVVRRLDEFSDARGFQVRLVDGQGRGMGGPDGHLLTDLSALPAVGRLMAGQTKGAFWSGDSLTAFARVEPMGWGVIIDQAGDEAWAEIRRSRLVTMAGTGASILAMLVLGLLFTSRITSKLRKVVAGAQAFSRGELETRVELESADELGVLAATFNHMGDELKASREEIEAWNRELSDRVEQRTSELEVAHQRLLRTSKLAAIGQLGAGVAHEVNNPLVGILGNVQLLLLKYKDEDKFRDSLLKVESAAKRCRDVIQNLLRFSEQEGDPDHVASDLHKILEDAYSLTAERILASGIEVRWQLAEHPPQVLGAPRQLMQVFLNLFTNSRTAMEKDGGQLTISTRVLDDQVEVAIGDTGKGISKENLERIFEPFFTTKDVWTNTGMGLSVAFRIVSDHGGRLDAESEPGQGSTFRVLLPLPEERA